MSTNLNFLSPIEFIFTIKRLPHVKYNIQSVDFPGISSGSTPQQTPFRVTPRAGDRLDYDDLTLEVIIDEEMRAYTETFDWLIGLTFPDKFSQYADLEGSEDSLYSDATLTILNSNKNPGIEIKFENLFPTNVGGFNLDTKSTTVVPPTSSIVFKYSKYDISLIT